MEEEASASRYIVVRYQPWAQQQHRVSGAGP